MGRRFKPWKISQGRQFAQVDFTALVRLVDESGVRIKVEEGQRLTVEIHQGSPDAKNIPERKLRAFYREGDGGDLTPATPSR